MTTSQENVPKSEPRQGANQYIYFVHFKIGDHGEANAEVATMAPITRIRDVQGVSKYLLANMYHKNIVIRSFQLLRVETYLDGEWKTTAVPMPDLVDIS